MQNKNLWILLAVIIVLSPLASYAGNSTSGKDAPFIYDDHGKRDPFWKLIGARGSIVNYDNDIQASDMVLEGIMAEPGGESVAIINGNIIKVGDKLGLFVVKEIQANVVILEKGQENIKLQLKKEE